MHIQDIIINQIISEKAIKAQEENKFSFIVKAAASKRDIKQAVSDMYRVKVLSVLTSINKGGRRKVGAKRTEISLGAWKKAIVKLNKGDKLNLFGKSENGDKKKGKK